MTIQIDQLEKLLTKGPDSAVLRFSLGNLYLPSDPVQAARHFAQATVLNPDYSAAWKMLGKAHTATGANDLARAAYSQGIATAELKGDLQAAKEMRVFLRRLNSPPK